MNSPKTPRTAKTFITPRPPSLVSFGAGRLLGLVAAFLFAFATAARAATYYWDSAPNLSGTFLNYGSGTVSTTSSNFWNTSNGSYVGWSNSTLDVMQIGSNTSSLDGRSYTGGSTAGSFSLTLSGAIALGELVVSGNLSSGGANAVTITDGGNSANNLTFGGADEINNNSPNTLIIDAQIAGAGGTLMDESLGTVIFTRNNTYNTGTIIEGDGSSTAGGVLQIGTSGTSGALGTGQVQFPLAAGQTTAATLRYDLSNAASVPNSIFLPSGNTVGAIIQQSGGNTLTLSGTETITNASATMTYNIAPTGLSVDTLVGGVITGGGSVLKSGSGALEFSGVDNYTGTTTINAGTLIIGGAGQLGSGSYAGNIAISSGASLVNNSTAAQTLSGLISGTGGLVQNGAGKLTLSSAETYTGGTVINGGIVILAGFTSGAAVQGTLLDSNITVNNGGAFQFGTSANYGNAATGSAPEPTVIAQNVTLNGGTFAVLPGNGSGITSANSATAVSLSGTLTLASGLNFVTLNGSGSGTESNSSLYTGLTAGFTRNAGTTLLVNAFPNTAGGSGGFAPGAAGGQDLLFTSGTTLIDGVMPGVFISQGGSNSDATTIATYNATDGVQVGSTDNTYSGSSGPLANTADQIATTNTSGTYTGTSSGAVNSLRIDASINLGGYTLAVNSGMILARANVSIATGTLALGAEGQIYVSNNNSVHTGNTGQSMSISSVITGSNGLTYTGGWTGQGTLTLSGDDTYTGATTVNTGTLLVTGSLAGTSSVAINNTGVLGGGGMVGAVGATGTTSVNAGGEIYPGATLATAGTKLTINNNVIFNNGGTLAINLDATHDTVDLLAINGNLTLNGTDALTLDLVGGALTGAVNYEIATYTGTLSGAFVAPANLTSAGYQIDYSQPGEIFLDVAAIPEPGACAMFVCGIGALIGIQRSRRRQTRD